MLATNANKEFFDEQLRKAEYRKLCNELVQHARMHRIAAKEVLDYFHELVDDNKSFEDAYAATKEKYDA